MLEALYAGMARLAETGWVPEALGHPFMVRAVLANLILAPVLGGLAPLVVTRKMVFFTSALGRSALAGLALGLLLGESLDRAYAGLYGFALLVALMATYARLRTRLSNESVVGVLQAFSLGLGICLLVAVTQRYDVHQIEAMLFGSVVTLTDRDLLVLAGVSALALGALIPITNGLYLASLDPALARARGIPVERNEYLFTAVLAVVVVASIELVGALLVEALVVVPAAAAANLARSLRGYTVWSFAIALGATQVGVLLGTVLPVPTGAVIVLVLAAVFALSFGWRVLTARA